MGAAQSTPLECAGACLGAFLLPSSGPSSGQVRSDRTGEVIFKDNLGASVSSILSAGEGTGTGTGARARARARTRTDARTRTRTHGRTDARTHTDTDGHAGTRKEAVEFTDPKPHRAAHKIPIRR